MIELHFDIHTYWHVGTGRGEAAVADAVVARTANGLPYIPGRAVKGLFRAAADLAAAAGQFDASLIPRLFGKALPSESREGLDGGEDESDQIERALEEHRFKPGGNASLRFSSASLGSEWSAWAEGASRDEQGPIVDTLFRRLASTSIDEQGVAKDQTLRTIEVAVPMVLVATVSPVEDAPNGWEAKLRSLCPLVRELGGDRNRGLGRVTVTVKERS